MKKFLKELVFYPPLLAFLCPNLIFIAWLTVKDLTAPESDVARGLSSCLYRAAVYSESGDERLNMLKRCVAELGLDERRVVRKGPLCGVDLDGIDPKILRAFVCKGCGDNRKLLGSGTGHGDDYVEAFDGSQRFVWTATAGR